MKLKKWGSFLLAFCMVLGFSSCGTTAPTGEGSSSAAATRLVTDRAGLEISLPAEINRIVVLMPSATETLLHFGLADKIVAIDTYSIGREGLDPNLPQLNTGSPSIETILMLKPDLVIAPHMLNGHGDNALDVLKDQGIAVAYIPTSDTIADIQKDIAFLADITGCTDEGEQVIAEMNEQLDQIRAIGETITEKKRVYFEIAAPPALYSFGKGVYLDEMLTLVGGENILSDMDSWYAVSAELVVERNPDVIFTNVNYMDNPVDEILTRPSFDHIKAVQNKDVYYIENTSSSLPNEYIVQALLEMGAYLYPEEYAALTK